MQSNTYQINKKMQIIQQPYDADYFVDLRIEKYLFHVKYNIY